MVSEWLDKSFPFLISSSDTDSMSLERSVNLPTWAPDIDDLLWYLKENVIAQRWFSAGGTKMEPMKFSGLNSTLKIRGLLFDTVDGLTALIHGSEGSVLGQVVQPDGKSAAYGSKNRTRDAIWRSIFTNVNTAKIQMAPNMWGLYLSTLWANNTPVLPSWVLPQQQRIASSWLSLNHRFNVAGRPLSSWIENSFQSSLVKTQNFLLKNLAFKGSRVVQEAQQEFFTELIYAISTKRLFTTKRGYVGAVHPLARKGDAVAIFPGIRMPAVLRKAGDMWHVIGEAYVHGVMDGEALKGMDAAQMTEFTIC